MRKRKGVQGGGGTEIAEKERHITVTVTVGPKTRREIKRETGMKEMKT